MARHVASRGIPAPASCQAPPAASATASGPPASAGSEASSRWSSPMWPGRDLGRKGCFDGDFFTAKSCSIYRGELDITKFHEYYLCIISVGVRMYVCIEM